jgi:ABC-type microcin C transport system permease subunit YejB
VGSTDAAIGAHGDAPGRTDGRVRNRPGDHADTQIDRRAEGRDVREQEGGDPEAHRLEEDRLDEACRPQEHHAEVPEARRRGEEGRDRAEAQDVRRSEGLDHPQAHDGAQEHHAEVPEARRRGEEGRDRAEAQDVRRSEGLDHPQAHDGAQEHHAEVPEARRRGEEGRDRAEAQDVRRSEGLDHPEANRFAEERVPTSSLSARFDGDRKDPGGRASRERLRNASRRRRSIASPP